MKFNFDYLKRWGLWAIIGLLSIIILIKIFTLFNELLALLIITIVFELIALALSEFALFIFTSIKFTKSFIIAEKERGAYARIIASIFIGVHLLVGIIILATYQSTIFNVLQGQ